MQVRVRSTRSHMDALEFVVVCLLVMSTSAVGSWKLASSIRDLSTPTRRYVFVGAFSFVSFFAALTLVRCTDQGTFVCVECGRFRNRLTVFGMEVRAGALQFETYASKFTD